MQDRVNFRLLKRNSMKIRLFTVLPALALLSLLGSTVSAAPTTAPAGKTGLNGRPGQPGGGRMRGMQRMANELGLTEAQKKKLMANMRATMPSYRALREDTKLTPDQKRAKMRSLREENQKKINAILTPAQRKKLETMMKERRNQRRDARAERKRP
jgi:protein CpxP